MSALFAVSGAKVEADADRPPIPSDTGELLEYEQPVCTAGY